MGFTILWNDSFCPGFRLYFDSVLIDTTAPRCLKIDPDSEVPTPLTHRALHETGGEPIPQNFLGTWNLHPCPEAILTGQNVSTLRPTGTPEQRPALLPVEHLEPGIVNQLSSTTSSD